MYHIVKNVASLITMSSEHHGLKALPQRVSHFAIDMFYIYASPKYTGNIHGMFLAGVVTKKRDFPQC